MIDSKTGNILRSRKASQRNTIGWFSIRIISSWAIRQTDIGAFTYINAKNGVVIEDFVQIGSHCAIYSVSTIDGKEGKVVLKENCTIGSHSVIMPGVTVGENAVVGAMSFVNCDIPDNCVSVGVPAKVIKNASRKGAKTQRGLED